MHFGELTPPEQRVLGCLIEKRWTTPDQYPLSLNALRLACNQSTNRDPVTDYDEPTVRSAAERLSRYGLARLASGHGSRAVKYRHLAEEALSLSRDELAVLAVLLLRGAQTPGELKARSERMAKVGSLAETEAVLAGLIERGYARRLDRRPGQKEDRFEHMLGAGQSAAVEPAPAVPERAAAESAAALPGPAPAESANTVLEPATAESVATVLEPASAESAAGGVGQHGAVGPAQAAVSGRHAADPGDDRGAALVGGLQGEVLALREEVSALREEVSALREELGALREELPAPHSPALTPPGDS